ncbi:hypothetical protein F4813DRAFT_87100 [Daldinia decipiens]|uniref:uncharacterized protein n=1 Tax=Daldinia decipiens TaxID=326647 RepID=UPI0020C4E993|nr:uncharacterized protein F4813DRAFT_87100 [Daldinia decipiens]KAI1657368.1 hypothetical protein F4813DRAFT_87100 [Daldinia decipiens]
MNGANMFNLDQSQIPSLAPPPGVTPNFIDPPTIAPTSRILTGLTLAIMYCLLTLRIYTRAWVTCNMGIEDCLCLVSAIGTTCYCSLILKAFDNTMGRHQWDIPMSEFHQKVVLKYSFAPSYVYSTAAVFIKATLLAFYLRIFNPVKGARILIWITLAVVILFYLIVVITIQVTCKGYTPTAQIFNTDAEVDCSVPQEPLWVTTSVFSTVTDLHLLAIPVALTLKIRLPPKQKIGVCCIFLTGLIACIFSLLCAVYRVKAIRSHDVTWLGHLVSAFAAVELNVGISCSCMPIVFVPFRRLTRTVLRDSLPKFISTYRKHNHRELRHEPSDPEIMIQLEQLPQVPKSSWTGLRSWVRKVHISQSGRVNDVSTYREIASVDIDYHKHLRKESRDARPPQYIPAEILQTPQRALTSRA